MMMQQQEQMMPEAPPQQGLSQLAQLIQQQGQGEDSILAHINAEEAQMLAQKYGHDINPITGLPQFGLLKKLGKKGKSFVQKTTPLGGKKFIQQEKKIFRYAAPVVGAVVGGYFGGPYGAALGGSIGGAAGAAVNKKSIPKGAILGGLGGYVGANGLTTHAPETAASMGLGGGALAGGTGASGAGTGLYTSGASGGASGAGTGLYTSGAGGGASSLSNYIANAKLGTLTNAYAATQGASTGAGGLGGGALLGSIGSKAKTGALLLPSFYQSLGGGQGHPGNASQQGSGPQQENVPHQQGQGGNSFLGSLLGGGNMLEKGLALTTIIGNAMRREKNPKEQSLEELMRGMPPQWGSHQQPRNISPFQRKYIPLPEDYSAATHGEHQFYNNSNPWQFREGGSVNLNNGGYIEGEDDGHADTRTVRLPDGAYVIDATTVANLGNGNSKAGALKLSQFEKSLLRKNSPRYVGGGSIRAKVSDGEYTFSPAAVANLGNGRNASGAKHLNNFVKNVRTHKGVKGFPPKAKSLQEYMHMRHR